MIYPILFAFLMAGCTFKTREDIKQNCKEVVDVGGCASSGRCKVRFKDGSVGYATLPIRHELICEDIF